MSFIGSFAVVSRVEECDVAFDPRTSKSQWDKRCSVENAKTRRLACSRYTPVPFSAALKGVMLPSRQKLWLSK